ncbi:MAG TPA: efflux RND transporter periplasmic adaptor subunit [Candidatus Dormibacteraeota bacterium]|nr:efflux RND transporter periplasmic adaptor subunit [Candidatus Dormibacteraeota bacterium]
MKNYRTAFLAVLAINVALLAALGVWWWHSRSAAAPTQSGSGTEVVAEGPMQKTVSSAAQPVPTTLVPLQLSPQRLQSIGVKVGVVERKVIHDDIRVVGSVSVDERTQAYVQTRFSGWIQKVFANANFQYVRKGEPLFTIYSQDLVATEREYLLAEQNERLLAKSTVPGVAEGARSLVKATLGRLRQWNLPRREIARLEHAGSVQQYLEIDSPVSGFITERNALPNLYVQPETRLYTVADFSTVWVYAEVFQNDLGRVRVGDPASLTVDSYPGRTFRGRVNFIYPDVDMATRTARVRLVFSNPGLLLKPGMFVNVDLEVPMGRQLVVPASAIFQTGTRQIAFIDRGGGYLDPREVLVGPQVGDSFIVLKGLKPNERIVTSANFLIDSESQLQAALGSFLPPPPGAGAAAARNVPQNNVEFSSIPSPPRKGSNTFQAKLTDAQGKGIAGAQVQVLFLMPAMPAMGMAAQRVAFNLEDKGGGVYQGQGALPSAGTWQVSIVAKRAGQVIASKHLSVNVSGGM